MKWLVTGGAGYIGSHVVFELLSRGEEVVIVDSLNTGLASRIPADVKLHRDDLRDFEAVRKILRSEKFHGVFHLAALKSVPESFKHESLYYDVNSKGTESLLELCAEYEIKKVIYSSTAAVYSSSGLSLKSEDETPAPENPYGKSKLRGENALSKYLANGVFEGTSLRFFNVIGSRGGDFRETKGDNLVPRVINQIRNNERPTIYGSDYKTRDGTCIRDFVDVRDIARAHILSAFTRGLPECLNIGTGKGNTVLEVVTETSNSLGTLCVPNFMERRNGDIESIVADISRAKKFLSFSPHFSISESISSSI
jgi:UDP-glucose 4-epimerase